MLPNRAIELIEVTFSDYMIGKINEKSFLNKMETALDALPFNSKKSFSVIISKNKNMSKEFFGFNVFPEMDKLEDICNKIANDVMKKAASKTGVDKLGWGMGSYYHDFGPNAQAKVDRASELTKRALKQNKGFKKAIKVDKIGTGVALTGAGLMAANHFLNKNKKKKDNE